MPVCPLSGIACPGVDECAPAHFSAFTDEDGVKHLRCPVSTVTDSMTALAFSMEPFVQNMIGTPAKKQPTVDEIGRDEFIAKYVRPESYEEGK